MILAFSAVALIAIIFAFLANFWQNKQIEKAEQDSQNRLAQTKESEALAGLNKTEKKQLEAYIKRIKKE